VQACQEAVTSHEFSEWLAFSRIHPFGEDMMDARFAALEALVANLWTDGKKRWKPEDFLPDYEKALDEAEEATPEISLADKVRAFFGPLAQASKQKSPPSRDPFPHL
jgi:hypothetical protein